VLREREVWNCDNPSGANGLISEELGFGFRMVRRAWSLVNTACKAKFT